MLDYTLRKSFRKMRGKTNVFEAISTPSESNRRALLDRWLFSESVVVRLLVVTIFSALFAYLLIGNQISAAHWGLIDDHEVFEILGRHSRLPLSEIWQAIILKTTEGPIFRPAYYGIRSLEIAFFGANVHLWYLLNFMCFTIFLGCAWWIMWPFLGGWLSGALTAYLALLPLWAGVWSRLGPSEIYGAACLGLILISANQGFAAAGERSRQFWAISLTLSTIAFIGMKETFLPFVMAPVCVLLVMAWTRRIPRLAVALLLAVLTITAVELAAEIYRRTAAAGQDYYGNPLGLSLIIRFALRGALQALLRTSWLLLLPPLFLIALGVLRWQTPSAWFRQSKVTIALYLFVIAMYAGQCGLYRGSFPTNMRYDFPAMLMVPATWCLLACDLSLRIRKHLYSTATNYAQLVTAAFIAFTLASGTTPTLYAAAKTNISATTTFSNEIGQIVAAAKQDPSRPVIIDAYSANSYEPVLSTVTYLRSFGVDNRISVRTHPDPALTGAFFEGLQSSLDGLQKTSDHGLNPLEDSLASSANGCLSVGILGPAQAGCSAFEITYLP
jgi:hypothetical protein